MSLQRKVEDGAQVNSDLQEQVIQLTKHVKVIPELRRDLNNLQNQKNNLDRKMKEQSEQTRGFQIYLSFFTTTPKINEALILTEYFVAAKTKEIVKQLLGGFVEEEKLLG